MAKKNEDVELIKARMTKADIQLQRAEEDFKTVQDFIKKYKQMQTNLKKLSEYYFTDWMEDIDTIEKKKLNLNYCSSNQDSIWNAIIDHREAQVELLKLLAKEL